jgi:hypothetical protein
MTRTDQYIGGTAAQRTDAPSRHRRCLSHQGMPKSTHVISAVAILTLLPLMSAVVAFGLVATVLWRSGAGGAPWHTAGNAAGVAALSAALVGAPAAHWAVTTGRRRIHQWIGLGAAAGGLLIVVPFSGHAIGALLRGETRVLGLSWGVVLRMILDALGLSELLRIQRGLLLVESLPVVIGALTGAAFWLLWRFEEKWDPHF